MLWILFPKTWTFLNVTNIYLNAINIVLTSAAKLKPRVLQRWWPHAVTTTTDTAMVATRWWKAMLGTLVTDVGNGGVAKNVVVLLSATGGGITTMVNYCHIFFATTSHSRSYYRQHFCCNHSWFSCDPATAATTFVATIIAFSYYLFVLQHSFTT